MALALHHLCQVSVQRFAVEGDDDHFAAVAVAALLLFFRHVEDGEGEVRDVAVCEDDTWPLDLVPVVHGAVGVADEILRGIVREAAQRPVVESVGGGEVERLALRMESALERLTRKE